MVYTQAINNPKQTLWYIEFSRPFAACGATVMDDRLDRYSMDGILGSMLLLNDFCCGAIAQLGEHLHGMQGVSGSIPLSSTKKAINCCFLSPSSRGLGHRPFTAATWVRIPLGTPYLSRGCTGKDCRVNGFIQNLYKTCNKNSL
jgi:hypothetical protein